MCGRFTLMLDAEDLQSEFGLQEVPADYVPRYNIAPTQPVGVITQLTDRRFEWMRWGLVPSWAKDPSIGSKMINARSETIQEKPSFRNAFLKRRCIIPADGFYEWKKLPGKGPSIPYYFYARDRKPFAFAGLWELWRSLDSVPLLTCTILTTGPNSLVSNFHDRMPVILRGQGMTEWLGSGDPASWQSLLQSYPSEEMNVHPVSNAVNSPANDRQDLVQQIREA
jgi:putative SOS response-associated peptidase YedK